MNMNRNNKYKAEKLTYEGMTFDSKKEARRYAQLRLLERAGIISNIRRQVEFVLIPAQYDIVLANGKHKRKCIERACKYIADFVYRDNEKGAVVVEDTKGIRTKDYIIKRKLMLYFYKIRIQEV